MKIFEDIEEIRNIPPAAVALGNFDGVHLGHQELIRRMVARARQDGPGRRRRLPFQLTRGICSPERRR